MGPDSCPSRSKLCILHGYADTLGIGYVVADDHGAGVAVVLDRVRKQVQQHLFQSRSIRHDADAAVGREHHPNGALACQRLHQVVAFQHQLPDRRGLRRERHAAGFDLRQIEDLVDQRQQVSSRLQDVVDELRFLRIGFLHRFRNKYLPETENRIQGRAQLMAHA